MANPLSARSFQNIALGLPIAALGLIWIIGAHSEAPEPCMDQASREKVRALMLDAIDDALRDHTKHMYEVWMKDPYSQPSRAITGMRAGIMAYVNSRNAALKFNPPLCKEPNP